MELHNILGYEGVYAATADGKIFRIKQHNRPIPYKIVPREKRGYLAAHLCLDGVRKDVLAHRAIWSAFNGPIPPGLEINHKNGKRDDNRLSNLEVVTRSGNQLHKFRINGCPAPNNPSFGEKNGSAKLTEEKVRLIRSLGAQGVIQKEIGRRFGVSQPMIGMILRREKWAQVKD